jgi:hypothetical protein
MKKRKARKLDLAGASIEQEVCLLATAADGTLYLRHIEAEVVDDESGERRGILLFNDDVKLPLGRFEFLPD